MLFDKDWRNKRKLYQLYAELRHHFDIAMTILCQTSLATLGKYHYFEDLSKTEFTYQFARCDLQVNINSDCLVINLLLRNYSSGHSYVFEEFFNECILKTITDNTDGTQKIIWAYKTRDPQYKNISHLCTKAINDLIKLDALIKETDKKKSRAIKAFEKTEFDFLLPFCKELQKENTSGTITAFCVKESGQSNIVKEEL